mmetsp:Transcript_25464/g.83859  ORF Transcript_25464/g.83859 Transcript_25464/m.83859 type:complete len:225 (+) Transcript_25464:611-1285(+)
MNITSALSLRSAAHAGSGCGCSPERLPPEGAPRSGGAEASAEALAGESSAGESSAGASEAPTASAAAPVKATSGAAARCRCRFCCRFRLRLCCRRRCRCRRNETCILCPQRAGRCLCVGQLGRQVRSLLLQTGDGGGGGGGLGCRRLQLASQVADLRLRLARRELGGCPRLVGRACRRVGRFSRLVDAAPRHRPHTRHRLLVTRLPLALSQRRLCRLRTRLTPH